MSAIETLAARFGSADLSLMSGPGVYLLLRQNEVVYVGQGRNALARIGTHSCVFAFDRAIFIAEHRRARRLALEGWKRRAARSVGAWRWASSAELVPESVAGAIWIALDDVTSRFATL